MSSPETQASQGTLRKELGLIVLIFMMIGLNVGGALFALTSKAAGLTGPSLFIAQIISALPVLLALIPYMIITSSVPKTAASYQYAKNFSYPLAAAGVMVLLVAMPLGGLPLFALTNGKFFMKLIPGAPDMVHGLPISWAQIVAITTVTIFYIINIMGIKPSAYIEFIMTALLILALLVFIIPGLPGVKLENFAPLFTGNVANPNLPPLLGQILGLIAAAALSYTLLAGGLFGIELGDEVKQAHFTIPRALIVSVFVVLILYIFIDIVAVGVNGWKFFADGDLSTPAQVFLGKSFFFGFFVIGGGIMACVTTVNAVLTISGRYTMKFAKDGFFPHFFTKISKKYGTPYWGLTLPFVLSVMILLFVRDFTVLGAMLNFGLLFMVSLVLLFVYNLPKKHPEIFVNSRYKFTPTILRITSLSAAILNIIFMLLLIFIMFKSKNQWAVWLFVIAIIGGLVLYYIKKKMGLVRKPEILTD
jgi:APA family basic amino acid/polyamine antiporter